MLLSFRRLSDQEPPERELLEVRDDGTFRMWRSFAPAVGRFEGRVPDVAALRALADATAGVPPPNTEELTPDASVEILESDGVEASVEATEHPGGPWGTLLAACRSLLNELLAQPSAALVAFIESRDRVRIEHRGTEVLPIELDLAAAYLTLWRDGREQSYAAAYGEGRGRAEAGPGWSTTFDLRGIEPDAEGTLGSSVSLAVEDDGTLVGVTINRATPRGPDRTGDDGE